MKIFVSTHKTQGQRANDFCFVPEGEIVIPPTMKCSGEAPDGHCGCNRSMGGVLTHKGTTTMRVAPLKCNYEKYVTMIYRSMQEQGWNTSYADAEEIADELTQAAEKFETGDIVEYRAGEFSVRQAAEVK